MDQTEPTLPTLPKDLHHEILMQMDVIGSLEVICNRLHPFHSTAATSHSFWKRLGELLKCPTFYDEINLYLHDYENYIRVFLLSYPKRIDIDTWGELIQQQYVDGPMKHSLGTYDFYNGHKSRARCAMLLEAALASLKPPHDVAGDQLVAQIQLLPGKNAKYINYSPLWRYHIDRFNNVHYQKLTTVPAQNLELCYYLTDVFEGLEIVVRRDITRHQFVIRGPPRYRAFIRALYNMYRGAFRYDYKE